MGVVTSYRCSTPIKSSEIAEEPRLFSSSFAAQVITLNIFEYSCANFTIQLSPARPVHALKDRITWMNALKERITWMNALKERITWMNESAYFQDFGKAIVINFYSVITKKFPSFLRDPQTLKNCWINYRKSAAAFLRF